MIQLYSHRPEVAASAGECPRATALARLQASRGPRLTSLWHANVRLGNPRSRRLVALLDGARDRAALGAILEAEGLAGAPEDVTDPEARRGTVAAQLDETLRELTHLALLTGGDVSR